MVRINRSYNYQGFPDNNARNKYSEDDLKERDHHEKYKHNLNSVMDNLQVDDQGRFYEHFKVLGRKGSITMNNSDYLRQNG